MAPSHEIVAGILVGGRSTRMGRNKALLAWNDATMVEAVAGVVQSVAAKHVLLGQLDPTPPSLVDVAHLPDVKPNLGPIGGLLTLLTHYPDNWCLLVGCDLPNITSELLLMLIDAIRPNARVVVFQGQFGLEPCCALYHGDLLPAVRSAIDQNKQALRHLFKPLHTVIVPADSNVTRALKNMNTPEDYKTL